MVNIDYLYNPELARNALKKDYFLDKKLDFQVIENGTILPHNHTDDDGNWTWLGLGGIVDSEGKFVENSYVHHDAFKNQFKTYTPPPESIQHSSETVIYLGMSYPIWGHCLTDNIRRVWFLKSDIFKNEFKNSPISYIAFDNQNLENMKSFRRLLEILEIDPDRLQEIKQPTQFKRIVLPDESFFAFGDIIGFTKEYRETIEQIRNFALKNQTPTSCKKIYYFHGRKGQFGEERLAEYFRSKGYEIIKPEKLTLDEQLNLLINCESFAATIGSISHNSVFLREGTQTIFIPRVSYKFNFYQEKLNQINSINANYIDSSLSIFRDTGFLSPCYIMSKQLKRFFGDKWEGYEEEDFKIFLQYVKDALRQNRQIVPLNKNYNRNYYDELLPDFIAQLKNHANLIADYDMQLDWNTFQPLLNYRTHVHKKGWNDGWKNENQTSNPLDQKLDIQAIKVSFPTWVHKLYYSVYYNDKEGWSEEVTAGQMAGTTGRSKPIYGMRVRFDEAGAKEFDIFYRMHKFDGTWTPWAKNGENLYSYGQKLNAIQIKLI